MNCNLRVSSQIWRSKNKTRRMRTVLFHIHARQRAKPFNRAGTGVRHDSANCWIFRRCSMLHLASLFHTNQRVSGLGYYPIEEAIDFKYGT